jgi:Txe/YoeB family toxin of Txe-Axe toxin-antitoxin module
MPFRIYHQSGEEIKIRKANNRLAEQDALERMKREANELLGRENPPPFQAATKPEQLDTLKGETTKG